jgi:hypothetical protein
MKVTILTLMGYTVIREKPQVPPGLVLPPMTLICTSEIQRNCKLKVQIKIVNLDLWVLTRRSFLSQTLPYSLKR